MQREEENPRLVKFTSLPDGIRNAGIARIEYRQKHSTVTDLVHISQEDWTTARWRFGIVAHLVETTGPIGSEVRRLANLCQVTERTLRRWMLAYRKNPDVIALLPHRRGPSLGHRRLPPECERLVNEVIDTWAARAEHLPVAWIVEECAKRASSQDVLVPSRATIEARLRDRGLSGLSRRTMPKSPQRRPEMPLSKEPLGIVQLDHTLVDVMVVDEVRRQSMGRPWITIAFDIATRVVLGFYLSLNPPSAVSVGLTLAMVCLPKDRWLKARDLKLDWSMAGVPRLLHLDNGKEFHSLALKRGCERYGISLEYRPPHRPQYGGHIERYLGTLMRRIHGLPGTTFSNPVERGKYRSDAKAVMTLAEVERWIALEIAGRYHERVHAGVHGIPKQLWAKAVRGRQLTTARDPQRLVINFLPAELRRISSNGFQLGRIRYWDPLLNRLFLPGTRMLVRFNPRDLSKVFVPSPTDAEYLQIPYADLRRPPITLAELERARTLLAEKGDTQPSEDNLFATTDVQRRIEDAATKTTRRARRNVERRPQPSIKPKKSKAKVNYGKKAVPYDGEVW